MASFEQLSVRIRAAWQGRICGCLLGKPLEVLSFQEGVSGVLSYLQQADALPLRDYVPRLANTRIDGVAPGCCLGEIVRAEADDDINYSVLALMLLEAHGARLQTADVARAWLRYLPAGSTWTAEREAYRALLNKMNSEFVNGAPAGFDLEECADNAYNDWIGAQIRADVYGWVCPGNPALAVQLATTDAALSHRGEGVYGAAFIAALGASIPVSTDIDQAIQAALQFIPKHSATADAVRFASKLEAGKQAVDQLQQKFDGLSPVHTLNNLAVVIWALKTADGDFAAAIGNAVSAGWDTDCNGATVGALFGLTGKPIPAAWTRPWRGRVVVDLAGVSELALESLVERTVAVARSFSTEEAAAC